MSTKRTSFTERRLELSGLSDDAQIIADDLTRYAESLRELARVLAREVAAMQRAEERFAKRAETKKAAPESRPYQPE